MKRRIWPKSDEDYEWCGTDKQVASKTTSLPKQRGGSIARPPVARPIGILVTSDHTKNGVS